MALLPFEKDTFVDEDIWKDTVGLSKAEAVKIQNDLINSWEPEREVWPLKYGSYTIAIACSASSVMINALFKRKLRLRYSGQTLTTIALMIGPGAMSSITHDILITENIMLYKNQCPICSELKAGLLLNVNAILYPLILSPTINLAVAANTGLRVPYMTEGREIAKFWWNVVRPAINRLSVAFCINSLIAGVIVYKQFEAANRMAYIIQQIKQYTEKH